MLGRQHALVLKHEAIDVFEFLVVDMHMRAFVFLFIHLSLFVGTRHSRAHTSEHTVFICPLVSDYLCFIPIESSLFSIVRARVRTLSRISPLPPLSYHTSFFCVLILAFLYIAPFRIFYLSCVAFCYTGDKGIISMRSSVLI